MIDLVKNKFLPDYAVPPGEILEDELASRRMSQVELARRTGLTKKTINEIVKGKAPITPESALKLERVFCQPAEYWLNIEKLFQEAQARKAERRKLQSDVVWLKKLPIRKMIELGWIRRREDDVAQLHEVLTFFGIALVDQWEVLWGRLEVAYRKSKAFEGQAEAISAWLRQGEIQAAQIEHSAFDLSGFKEALLTIRSLTLEPDPSVFVPSLREHCAESGVAVVFVPELPRTHVSGATRWLSKEQPLIQLSLRYKSDDHLWFTFFHEAGHILKHGKKALFLEGEGVEGELEAEADRFASNLLIPRKDLTAFVKGQLSYYQRHRFSTSAVVEFADRLGIAPGIVVGRLQHYGWIPYTHLNRVKNRLHWSLGIPQSQPEK